MPTGHRWPTVDRVRIVWLDITDPPELWARLGFEVEGGSCVVNGVEHRLIGPTGDAAQGVVRWGVDGIDPSITEIAGIPTVVVDRPEVPDEVRHPNGVFRIDHLVLRTSSTPGTVAALAQVGLEIRGQRATTARGAAVDMRFAWAGDTLLEIAGPPEPDGDGTTDVSGIAYATDDLDGAAARLGSMATTPVDAAQPGRRIFAVRSDAGSSVPIAFMTPHVKAR